MVKSELVVRGRGKKLRGWRPSPDPGIELEYFSTPMQVPLEGFGVHRDAVQVRKLLRLWGWVSWILDKIDDWLDFARGYSGPKPFNCDRVMFGEYDDIDDE
ncbi:hypothetical protein VTL71DRAFT_14143 [Oculimacula yallundae]|uniref:Uncharacterized protein n=1 Tax=Oculimacula yallundae TaxID=86028 RepID=A0ABR4CI81_9HELO